MKKLILSVVAVAAFASYNFYQSNNEPEGMTEISLNEVEALANDEWNDLVSCSCGLLWGSGCKRDNWGVDCATSGIADCSRYDGSCS